MDTTEAQRFAQTILNHHQFENGWDIFNAAILPDEWITLKSLWDLPPVYAYKNNSILTTLEKYQVISHLHREIGWFDKVLYDIGNLHTEDYRENMEREIDFDAGALTSFLRSKKLIENNFRVGIY